MQRETRIAHYAVGVLTALSLVLLSLPLSSPVRSFKTCVSYVTDPLPYEGEQGYQKLAGAPERVRALLSADIENARLRDELKSLEWLKTTVASLATQNERLRQELALKPAPSLHPVWAHMLERDPQNWYGSVAVDAGRDRGVSLNDAVLGRKDGELVAVGRVVEVQPRTSTVMLLTDQRSAVAAYLSSGTLEGLVQGRRDDPAHAVMSYIDADSRIVPGDSIYTSPISATFPPDVLIGKVVRIYPRDPSLSFQSVEVAPALDAADLAEVLILSAHPLPGGTSASAPAPVARPAP
ncbi:MAG: rod shape-determining protein MreC, partial [Elusimicrobia bacterium]|nr:rod shape-determining protein MreC [Elusimicrobiota bacterium]